MAEPVSAFDPVEPAMIAADAEAHREIKPLAEPMDPLEVVEALPEQIVDAGTAFAQTAERAAALTAEEARVSYGQLRKEAEEAASTMEAAVSAAGSGIAEFNEKAIEAVKASADAWLDFARAMAGARTLSEVVELQTEHLRKQYENANAQAKEFAALASKISSRAMAPLGDTFGKAFGATAATKF